MGSSKGLKQRANNSRENSIILVKYIYTCLQGGKYESAGNSRIGALDESVIDDMIEVAKKIAYDYEHGFSKTKDEKACGDCGFKLYCGD